MKLSLLEMVQDIANDLDTDETNSIDDTVESAQIAQIIKTCYLEMMANRNWPHQRKLIQLDSIATLEKPNYLVLPENVKELEILKYDTRKLIGDDLNYTELRYKEPEAFLRYVSSRRSSEANIQTVVDFSGTSLLIHNDTAPTFWTSFDDTHIVLDAWNTTVDSTVKKSKTQAIVYINPTWVHEDDAIPDMPSEAFPALLEEAKSTAFFTLKQMVNSKAEQKAGRQQRWLSRKAWRAKGGVQYDNYGRKGRK